MPARQLGPRFGTLESPGNGEVDRPWVTPAPVVSLSSSPNPSGVGEPIAFTATVTPQDTGRTNPTGRVQLTTVPPVNQSVSRLACLETPTTPGR
jgi:hypothetical protein